MLRRTLERSVPLTNASKIPSEDVMGEVVIKVENLSKQYKLGLINRKTFHADFNSFLYRLLGKNDPYLKIGEHKDRVKASGEYIWALKNIDFEVKQGEVLGIIGNNGAGKSTLLKILSKVTAPTTGQIKLKGRIASLLEVGTGFHPELSGRDNVFLNGAILGMTRKETQTKIDEIINFAGVERFIDTPVKRYSSGMYVRLAFAVAAHLEPDILIVDEVLAVGDAEFQKKCLGKMKEVSVKEGRTVLFVSHNMDAVNNLCDTSVLLDKGKIIFRGKTTAAIDAYLKNDSHDLIATYAKPDTKRREDVYEWPVIDKVQLLDGEKINAFSTEGSIHLLFEIVGKNLSKAFRIGCRIVNANNLPVGLFFTPNINAAEGTADNRMSLKLSLRNHFLTKGKYYMDFSIGTGDETSSVLDYEVIQKAISFEITRINDKESTRITTWNTANWGSVNFRDIKVTVI